MTCDCRYWRGCCLHPQRLGRYGDKYDKDSPIQAWLMRWFDWRKMEVKAQSWKERRRHRRGYRPTIPLQFQAPRCPGETK
jgi:hypothetical protein